jgi:exodeoxyribonuclease VII small subunit
MVTNAKGEENESIDFEAAIGELEKVVTQLDSETKLEKALALFERGMKLSSQCEAVLKAAEQKVEVLKRSADGELVLESFGKATNENNRDNEEDDEDYDGESDEDDED